MATEDDNFDIDIYGDGSGYNANDQGDDMKHDDSELILDAPDQPQTSGAAQNDGFTETDAKQDHADGTGANGEHVTQPESNTQHTSSETPAPTQGVKRKEHDDRPTDPDAMPALLISDLFWWTTDDDIRGWVRQADCEDELKDVTFSEHKVNGKSKGYGMHIIQHYPTVLSKLRTDKSLSNSPRCRRLPPQNTRSSHSTSRGKPAANTQSPTQARNPTRSARCPRTPPCARTTRRAPCPAGSTRPTRT